MTGDPKVHGRIRFGQGRPEAIGKLRFLLDAGDLPKYRAMSTRDLLVHCVDVSKGIEKRGEGVRWNARRRLELVAEVLGSRTDEPLALMALDDVRRMWRRAA